jgi:hypothetical protein
MATAASIAGTMIQATIAGERQVELSVVSNSLLFFPWQSWLLRLLAMGQI